MKNLLIDGTKLNFIELNNDKEQTLLFLHGNSHSLKTFSNQYSADLLSNYHLVFVDLPGHGDSSKDGNYSLKNFALIIHQFILALDLKNIIVVGHSMGGHVAINLLKHYTPSGLFLFGTPPLKNPFDPNVFIPNANATALGQGHSTLVEVESLMGEMNYKEQFMKLAVEDYLKTDPAFRTDVLSDVINGVNENEIALINSFKNPLMFLLATRDSMINNEYILNEFQGTHKEALIEIEAGHSPHIESSEMFNEMLSDFSKKVFDNCLENINIHNVLQHESRL